MNNENIALKSLCVRKLNLALLKKKIDSEENQIGYISNVSPLKTLHIKSSRKHN